MYRINPTLLERAREREQTKAKNSDIRPLVYITRNRTAITSQRFWERQMITPNVGTRSSIAVRRPEGHLLGDMIFTAQIEQGDAIIRCAERRIDINDMVWEQVAAIPNVSELSIMFDGYMKKVDGVVEAYTVGELPWVFYVDSNDALKYMNLDGDEEGTVSDNAVNIASVRGLYSETAGLDDGIWLFYTNYLGELWEARLFGGEIVELTKITKKPNEDITAWEDIWAGLTFDYRIVLQLKGNDGKVYTLVGKSRPSGYTINEYLRVSKIKIEGRFGLIPPELVSVQNIPIGNNYGKRLRLIFDQAVSHVSVVELDRWALRNMYGEDIRPTSISYGEAQQIVHLDFEDFNSIVEPATLECLGCVKMGSADMPLDPFSWPVSLARLHPVPGDFEFLAVTGIKIEGQLTEAFNGKLYVDEHLRVASIGIQGDNAEVTFAECRGAEYLSVTSIEIVGNFWHIDEVPV